MKILVLGAGNMGAFFIDTLCLEYDVAVYDTNVERMKYLFRTRRLEQLEDVRDFAPDLLINAVSLQYTQDAFAKILPYIPEIGYCICKKWIIKLLSNIATPVCVYASHVWAYVR
jgi:hypothetical protein